MIGRAVLIAALVIPALVACKKADGPAPTGPAAPSNTEAAPGPDSVSEPEPEPAPLPEPVEVPPPADGRPASVTSEMVAVADRMILAMEAMGRDLTAAGTDCGKGASALSTHAKLLRPIALDAQKFENKDDKAAEEWFKTNYMPRMMASLGGLMTLSRDCATDQRFQAASEEFGKAMEM